jgi:hypothetical protein
MATLPTPAKRNGASLNLFMAVLAAASLAFLFYAMPDHIFSGLVERSGLPGLIAAAQPPLGMKARAAAIAAVAFLVFALVLVLMRAIDRVSAAAPEARAPVEDEPEAPRLRRADAHPDAPARRPLLAGRDLGEFADPDDFGPLEPLEEAQEEERFADLPAQPLPGFPIARPEPAEPEIEYVEAQAGIEPEIEPEAEPLILDTVSRDDGFDELVSQLPQVGQIRDDASIGDLMRRLEGGLSAREEAVDVEPVAGEPVAVEPITEPVAEAPEPEIAAAPEQEPRPPFVPMAAAEAAPEPQAPAEEPEYSPAQPEAGIEAPVPIARPLPSFLQPVRAQEEEVAEEAAEAEDFAEPEEAEPEPEPVAARPLPSFLQPKAPSPAEPAEIAAEEQDFADHDDFTDEGEEEEAEESEEGESGAEEMEEPSRLLARKKAITREPFPLEPRFTEHEPPPIEQQVGHRLRNAIGGLNKMAGRS